MIAIRSAHLGRHFAVHHRHRLVLPDWNTFEIGFSFFLRVKARCGAARAVSRRANHGDRPAFCLNLRSTTRREEQKPWCQAILPASTILRRANSLRQATSPAVDFDDVLFNIRSENWYRLWRCVRSVTIDLSLLTMILTPALEARAE